MSTIERHQRYWSQIAKEPVTVEEQGGAYYAFGSELACLRIFYEFRHTFRVRPDEVRTGYSDNLKTHYFRLEKNFS